MNNTYPTSAPAMTIDPKSGGKRVSDELCELEKRIQALTETAGERLAPVILSKATAGECRPDEPHPVAAPLFTGMLDSIRRMHSMLDAAFTIITSADV